MSKLTPIRRSKAKTAWGLLGDVERTILAEPKRVNMRMTVARLEGRDIYVRMAFAPAGVPACETVGCFAGWTALLALPREAGLRGDVIALAHRLLGGDNDYSFQDRESETHTVFNAGGGDRCERTKPGTPAHARAVVQRIRRFKRKNAKTLRAQKIGPVVREILREARA